MPFHVVDSNERDTKTVRQGLAKIQPDKERTNETRSESRCNRIQISFLATGGVKGFLHNLRDEALVGPRGQFRHNAAVFPVYILRRDHVRRDPAIPHDCRRGFVTRCFDSENSHDL
jgi:hypothetical protein